MPDMIPQADLDRAGRALCRRLAAVLVTAMAEADMSFEDIALRLSVKPRTVRHAFARLLAGHGTIFTVATIGFALGIGISLQLQPDAPKTESQADA